jgi:hypothetical protein
MDGIIGILDFFAKFFPAQFQVTLQLGGLGEAISSCASLLCSGSGHAVHRT